MIFFLELSEYKLKNLEAMVEFLGHAVYVFKKGNQYPIIKLENQRAGNA